MPADRPGCKSVACRAVSAPEAGTGRRRKAIGLRSWLCCRSSPPYGAQKARPRARRPSNRNAMGTLLASDRPVYTQQLRDAGALVAGVGCAGGARSVSGAAIAYVSGWVSVSVVALLVAVWGVVRLEARRSRACRSSRGRRPSGCGSEVMGRRAGLPQSHLGAVAGPLTRTRLRRGCRLQRPSSSLTVSRAADFVR